MEIKRSILKALQDWKKAKKRKPLILRGARQVGKTTIINQFGGQFNHYIYLNLELNKDKKFFINEDDVSVILDSIILEKDIDLKNEETLLLFIDEIQEVPEVINLLRYFYEELPKIHVIAAGSLLEFALGDISKVPVGRVQFLHMHPLNFEEFLSAHQKKSWLEAFHHVPVSKSAHNLLMKQFHTYGILGGMPEIIQTYLEDKSMSRVSSVYQSIWQTYKSDIEKYTSNESEKRIVRHILETAPYYFDERVKFQNFGNSNYRSREVSEAFKNLDAAGLIRLLFPTTSITPPIQKDFKKSPRLQFLDIGIVNHIRKVQSELLLMPDLSEAYRGALIPQMIYQELISTNNLEIEKPIFWVRDKAQSSAEVDLVYHYKDKIIPIEIKSGATGSLKSLQQFINRTDHNYAIRIFQGEFSIQKHTTPEGKEYHLMNLPYYLGTKIKDYVAFFVGE